MIEHDEDVLKKGAQSGGRRSEIFEAGVLTGVDMENGYLLLAL